MAPRRKPFDPNDPPPITEQDLINQAIGPRTAEPKSLDPGFGLHQSYFPTPPANTPDFRAKPEAGLHDQWDTQGQAILDALTHFASNAGAIAQHTMQGGGMAVQDALSGGTHALASDANPFAFAFSPKANPVAQSLSNSQDERDALRTEVGERSGPAEMATAHAFDFLFGPGRDTSATPQALEAQHTVGVRNAQDALASKINRVGDYSDLTIPGMPSLGHDASPEQIQAALFPQHSNDYGRGETRFTGVQAKQQQLAKEALGGIPDVRTAARDPGGVLTTPFDVANAQIDAQAQGKPQPSQAVLNALLNTHQPVVADNTAPNKETVRRNFNATQHPAVAALGPVEHAGTIPLQALNDEGMESDITTPLDDVGGGEESRYQAPVIPSGSDARGMLKNDPRGLLRSIQDALASQRSDPAAPLQTPDRGFEQDMSAAPAGAPKKMLPPVKPVASAMPSGDMFPQPAASMMRGADGKISGMRMGGKLISFERDSQGKIANIHIFEGAKQ